MDSIANHILVTSGLLVVRSVLLQLLPLRLVLLVSPRRRWEKISPRLLVTGYVSLIFSLVRGPLLTVIIERLACDR